MKKILAIISKDPKLQDFSKELNSVFEFSKNKLEFANKQRDDIIENSKTQARKVWLKLETYFKEQGILPKDYSPSEESFLSYDEKTDGIFLNVKDKNNSNSSFSEFLREMFSNDE